MLVARERRTAGIACTAQLQLRHPELCPLAGPASQLAEQAQAGLYPLPPLPTAPGDPTLGDLPFKYRRLDKGGALVYSSAEDAARDVDPSSHFDAGFLWVSWDECQTIEGVAVYRIREGSYVRGGGSCKELALPSFRGLAFRDTPRLPFGWVLQDTFTSYTPGSDEALTSHELLRFAVVQVLETQKIGAWDWYRIGDNEWVEQRKLALVQPDTRRPLGVDGERWISVNLYEQTLAAYDQGRMVYATLVSSGLAKWSTRTGVFQVHTKWARDRMSGAFEADHSDYYYLEDVPWVLYFDETRALHGAYWHNGFGYPRSHGCVNLSPADSHWLFDWAEEGTWVHVWDPSGRSPAASEGSGLVLGHLGA
ncbi:MAG TPA: L,D-transpeptidase [Anaerolineales bacterium]|nr:L,D-transpeptidase [Anaerolineales bacterium]